MRVVLRIFVVGVVVGAGLIWWSGRIANPVDSAMVNWIGWLVLMLGVYGSVYAARLVAIGYFVGRGYRSSRGE